MVKVRNLLFGSFFLFGAYKCFAADESLFQSQTRILVQHCGLDIDKHCKAEFSENDDPLACLKKQRSDLSDLCISKIDQIVIPIAPYHYFFKGCKVELKVLCDQVPQGQGRKIKCIEEHVSKISRECRIALVRAKQEMAHEKK